MRGINALHRWRGASTSRTVPWHPNIGQHRVRPGALDRVEQLRGRADCRLHGHLTGFFKQPAGSLTDEVVVVGDYDAQLIAHPSGSAAARPHPTGTGSTVVARAGTGLLRRERNFSAQPGAQSQRAVDCEFPAHNGDPNRVGELAQVDEHVTGIALQLVERLFAALVTTAQPLPREGELRGQGDEVLLEPVVQVTLDPLSLRVLRPRDSGPGRGQLRRLLLDDL